MIEDVRSGMMAAMKNKDKVRKDALSALLSALKSKTIELGGNRADISDEDAIAECSQTADGAAGAGSYGKAFFQRYRGKGISGRT